MANGNGKLTATIASIAFTVIIGLVGLVWALTWKETKADVCENKEQIRKNADNIREIEKYIAASQERYNAINDKLEKIYDEVKGK